MPKMVRKYALRSSLVVVLLAPAGVLTPSAAAAAEQAVPGIAPSETRTGGVFRSWERAGRYMSEKGVAQLIGCTPETGVDNPHRSSTGVAVSGHGWWNKGNCSSDTATVTVCLYEYYTDGTWRQKACNTDGNLKPGGGSSRRVPARHDCDGTEMTSWRNHVDVDVNWEIDSGEVPYRQADVACRVG